MEEPQRTSRGRALAELAELAKDFELGAPIPGTRCMRLGCHEHRWSHPARGELVLCREHAREVLRGEAAPPPLRQRIDYQASGRNTFLVMDLPKPKQD